MRIGFGVEVPQALGAKAYADFIAEAASLEDESQVESLAESGFSIGRLRRSFTVGCYNGDPIFIDADTGKIFIYRHDGGDVEPFAESVQSLLEGSDFG